MNSSWHLLACASSGMVAGAVLTRLWDVTAGAGTTTSTSVASHRVRNGQPVENRAGFVETSASTMGGGSGSASSSSSSTTWTSPGVPLSRNVDIEARLKQQEQDCPPEVRAVFQQLVHLDDRSSSGDEVLVSRRAFLKALSPDGFLGANLGLDPREIERVWDRIAGESKEFINLRQFQQGQSLPLLQSAVHRAPQSQARRFHLPEQYDYSKQTNDNYRADNMDFFGDFADIRKSRDYKYHVNYTHERQAWQDSLVQTVVAKSTPQPAPWIVFTAGPMGAGKSHVITWMSRNGFFPLESIVRIDPDRVKEAFPEWKGYIHNNEKQAGTLCHRESGFIQEICQEAALRRAQNIWVDGTLRDHEWFSRVFTDIRRRFPSYRIAIFVVSASESVIRERITRRALETGRHIPEETIVSALSATPVSIYNLTPLVDFVARIDNDDSPNLLSCSVIDASHDFSAISRRFANPDVGMSWFPSSLSPLIMRPVPLTEPAQLLNEQSSARGSSFTAEISCFSSLLKSRNLDPSLTFSPKHPVTLHADARALASVPDKASMFAFLHPHRGFTDNFKSSEDLPIEVARLLGVGGFVYFDANGHILGINAVYSIGFELCASHFGSGTKSAARPRLLQFGSPTFVHDETTQSLARLKRWEPVTVESLLVKDARYFAWIRPFETRELGITTEAPHGGFAYLFGEPDEQNLDGRDRFFPIIS